MVWKSHDVYVDKMKELVESLLAYGYYNCVIVTLLNDIWHFLFNGWSVVVLGGEVILLLHWGNGCWLLVGVERWLLQGGLQCTKI